MSDLDAALEWVAEAGKTPGTKKFKLPKNTPESKNVEDRTGQSEISKFLNSILMRLNPVYAYDKMRPQGLDFRGVQPSRHLEDRTGQKPTPELIERLFFDVLRNTTQPGELLKDVDHRQMIVDPVFNIAQDPFRFKSRTKAK